MLVYPFDHWHYKLIALDPGLNNIGVAVFQVDWTEFEIKQIRTFTIQPQHVFDKTPIDSEIHDGKTEKLYKVRSAWRNVLHNERPDDVAVESPFFDRRKPTSFAILTEVLSMLLDELIYYNAQLKLTYIAPLKVKQFLGVSGQKGKEPIYVAFVQRPEILSLLDKPLDLLSEHERDAVGVGLTYLDFCKGESP